MSIITGRGDAGETDLLFGKRIAKSSLRIEALGWVDELSAPSAWHVTRQPRGRRECGILLR